MSGPDDLSRGAGRDLPGLMPSGGAARRAIGGTLMATGAATATFFALITAWFATDALGDLVRSAFRDPAAVWTVLRVLAEGGLAVGACALLAGLGRLILGPRPPP